MTIGSALWETGGQKPIVGWGPEMPEGGVEGSRSGDPRLEDVLGD